jgi:hypothetical protein
MLLLFAGFDATSSSLTYMLWLLTQHSHMVQKVRSLQHSQYYSKITTWVCTAVLLCCWCNRLRRHTCSMEKLGSWLGSGQWQEGLLPAQLVNGGIPRV